MSKKNKTRQPIKPVQHSGAKKSTFESAAPAIELPAFFKTPLLQGIVIFVFAILLYANTLGHGFVLDDSIVIKDNMYTTQGVKGIPGIVSKDTFFGFFKVEGKDKLVSGGRYRPMTLILFAIIFQLAGDNSFIFHLLTIGLFAATCLVFYHTLRLLLAPRGNDYANLFAFISAIIFAAHPIHTEVVANIKGCDEIVTLLCSLGALYATIRAFDTGNIKWTIAAGVSFFAACMSKENAATFLAIIPLALWFFRKPSASGIIRHVWPVFAAFFVFFAIRARILGMSFGGAPMEIMNNPYLKIEGNQWVKFAYSEKLATILYSLLQYIKLLFVPHPLTHDYYPNHIGLVRFSNPVALFSLALHIGLAWYAIAGIGKRDPLRFGILFYLITLSIVSNIVFPVGTNMGERFVFMPSAGFCLVLTALILKFTNSKTALIAAGVIAILFGIKTLTRNPAWASNEKLFFTDVKISEKSAKIQNACGGTLFDKARVEKDPTLQKQYAQDAIPHLNKALEVHPNYKDVFMARGGCYFILRNFDASLSDYRRAIELGADKDKIEPSMAMVLRDQGKFLGEQKGDLPNAEKKLLESWQLNPKDPETARLLGVAHGVQGKHSEAISWFEKSVALAPQEAAMYYDLGNAYYASGNTVKGEAYRKKALDMNPKLLEQRKGK